MPTLDECLRVTVTILSYEASAWVFRNWHKAQILRVTFRWPVSVSLKPVQEPKDE